LENKVKKMQKTQSILTVLVIGLLVITAILAYNNKQPVFLLKEQQNNIVVSGSDDISVESDMAEVYIKVLTLEKTASEARDENAKISSKVTDSLIKLGIKKNQIETSSFNLYKKEEWNPKTEQQEFKGYELTHVLKITTEELNQVSMIIDRSIDDGANGIGNVVFGLTDEKQSTVKEEVIHTAAKKAAEKAKILSKSLNVKLGKISSISESNYIQQPYYMPTMAESFVKETPISPGKVEVSALVTITYKI